MPIKKTQAAVVNAATRQTMKLVSREIDANHDKRLDDAEVKSLMTAIDAFTDGGGPGAVGPLPAEKTRMQMAVMQALTRMGDDPKFNNAESVKLSDLRVNLKQTFNELITTAKKVDEGGLMSGLGGLLSMVMLPDVAVRHIQETLARREE
jgi:hypothetical protein